MKRDEPGQIGLVVPSSSVVVPVLVASALNTQLSGLTENTGNKGSNKMKMKLTEAEEKLNTDEEFSAWWDKNYKKACDFAGNNADVIAHALYDAADEEDADALDAFYDQTAKHMALDGLYMLGIDEFEALMGDYSRVNVKDWARVVDEGWSEDDVRDAMTQAMLDAEVEDVGDYDQGGDTVAKKLGELGVDVRPYFNAENRSDYGDDDGEDLDETFRGVYRKTLREAAVDEDDVKTVIGIAKANGLRVYGDDGVHIPSVEISTWGKEKNISLYFETGDRGPRKDHGGGDNGDDWMDSETEAARFAPYYKKWAPRANAFKAALKAAGYDADVVVDSDEKGYISLTGGVSKI